MVGKLCLSCSQATILRPWTREEGLDVCSALFWVTADSSFVPIALWSVSLGQPIFKFRYTFCICGLIVKKVHSDFLYVAYY